MKVMCSGAGGFIGGHLVARLLAEGHEVRAVDIKHPSSWWQLHPGAESVQADLSDIDACRSVCVGVDHVYHLAADMGGMGFLDAERVATLHTVDITSSMIRAAYDAGVSRYFQASSACVYPDFMQQTEAVWLKESDAWPADPEPCLSPDTEVMTKRGFKPITEIGFDDEVATLAPDGHLEFHRPTALQKVPFDGDLIHFKGRSYDQLVTPGHKVFAQTGASAPWERISAEVLATAPRYGKGKFRRDALWEGKPAPEFVEISGVEYEGRLEHTVGNRRKGGMSIPIDAYLGLLGWYITEGNCGKYGANHIVSIRQCKPEGITAIAEVLTAAGLKFSFRPEGRFNLHSKPLWVHFKEFGRDAVSKRLPDWVLDLQPEKLRILLAAMIAGDGNVRRGNGHRTYYTSSPTLRDQVVELCMKVGISCTLGRARVNEATGNECVSISLSENSIHNVQPENISYEPYTGYVYDLTVPNHVFYIRRNGRHVWTGNCYGLEKLVGEQFCKWYGIQRGLETRVARYHNVYGQNGSWQGGREKAPAAICRKVAEAALSGKREIEIWGDGEQTRSFMFVDDCVEGTRRLMDSDFGQPLNIGSSTLVTINQLVDIVEEIAGVILKRSYNLDAPQGVRGRSSDNHLILDVLGWQPTTPLRDGLKRTYAWVYDQVKAASR